MKLHVVKRNDDIQFIHPSKKEAIKYLEEEVRPMSLLFGVYKISKTEYRCDDITWYVEEWDVILNGAKKL